MVRRALVSACLIIAAVAWTASAASGSFPGRNGQLAWSGRYDGCSEIRVFRRDLTDPTTIASTCAGGFSVPAFSPNGRRVLFASSATVRGRLVTVGADGRHRRRLPLRGFDPTWAPDGRHLAFTEAPGGGALWRARRDGTHRRRLLRAADEPRWSPSGKEIAYLRYPESGGAELRLANASTGRPIRILSESAGPFDFSPSGRRIVYSQPVDSPYEDACGLYVVRVDGRRAPARLSGGACGADSLAWSPDGSSIAYFTREWDDEQPYENLYMLPAGGGRAKLVYSTAEGNVDEPVNPRLSWQPGRPR